MADRSVVVRLKADINQYLAGMQRAKTEAVSFGKEVSGAGKTARADVEAVGRTALIAGGVMAVGLGKGIQVAMGFEKQMSGVKAVSGATAEEMKRLSDAALAAGASQTLAGVTASDAAAAEAELVKAGVSVSDVLGGALMGSLTLASAGQIEFADAATIAAQAMNIFDLSGGQVVHVADLLAAAANKSAGDVTGFGDALRQGGLVAAQTGLTIEETVAGLAAFADNALIGSDAGTSLKTMLQRLTPTSKEAAELMEEIGFSAYDAQGNFIGLQGLADELQTSLAGMTDEQRNLAMATLFGSDAVRGANVLYEEGAEGMKEYEEAVNDAGAAAEMAAIQNDNLSGDIEALGGAIETALIQNGSKANGIMRGMAQGATDMVNGFSSAPELLQTGAMGLAAVATAGTLAVGAIGTLAPKAAIAKEALSGMGTSGQFLADNMGKLAGAVTVAGAGLAVFATWQAGMAGAQARVADMTAGWEGLAYSAKNTADLHAFALAMVEVNHQAGIWSDRAVEGKNPFRKEELQETADTLFALREQMELDSDAAERLADRFGLSEEAALKFVTTQRAADPTIFADGLDSANSALAENFEATTTGTVGAHKLEAGMDTLGSEIASVEDQVKAFNDTLDALYNQLFGAEAARDSFQRGLNAMPQAIKDAATAGVDLDDVLNGNSDAAITLRDHMRGMVSDASDLIAEWQEQGAEGEELQIAIDMLSESWRQQAIDAGMPAPVVDHYLGLLDQIPTEKKTPISVPGVDEAVTRLWAFKSMIDSIPKSVTVTVNGVVENRPNVDYRTGGAAAGGLVPQYLAGGGWTMGYGPRGTDTVPAWLTPGEYVVNRDAVDALGVPFLDALNSGITAATGASSSTGASVDRGVHLHGNIANYYPRPEAPSDTVLRVTRKANALAGV